MLTWSLIIQFQVLGSWSFELILVLGSWFFILGSWSFILGTWSFILGSKFLELGAESLVLRCWFLFLGFWPSVLVTITKISYIFLSTQILISKYQNRANFLIFFSAQFSAIYCYILELHYVLLCENHLNIVLYRHPAMLLHCMVDNNNYNCVKKKYHLYNIN